MNVPKVVLSQSFGNFFNDFAPQPTTPQPAAQWHKVAARVPEYLTANDETSKLIRNKISF